MQEYRQELKHYNLVRGPKKKKETTSICQVGKGINDIVWGLKLTSHAYMCVCIYMSTSFTNTVN